MMGQVAQSKQERAETKVALTADITIESKLALRWLELLIRQPPAKLSADDYVTLLAWRRDLLLTGKGMSSGRLTSQHGPMLLAAACRNARARDADWWRSSGEHSQASSFASNVKSKAADPADQSPWEKLPGELWDAFTAPTNLLGSALGAGSTADALVKSLPLKWQVTLEHGAWELYDQNATQRIRKYGKGAIGKARIPPRMVLRARGARIGWMWQSGARIGANSTRFPVTAGVKTVADALRMIKADKMKLIGKEAYEAFKLRKLAGGTAVGLAVATIPQMIQDARDAKLFSQPNAAHWNDFLIKEAKSQSANIAGVVAGAATGLVLGLAGVTAAPVVILAGLVVGAGGQAAFNAFGFSGDLEKLASNALLGK